MQVVIVDDQVSARNMIAGLVKGIHDSIEVKDFWEPEEALEWCIWHGPEIVLLDYRMPSLDGVSFIQRLKNSPMGARTSVIMVSSQDDSSIRQAALEAGAVVFVRKPIAPKELQLCVRNLLSTMTTLATADARTQASAVQAGGLAALVRLASVSREGHDWMSHSVVPADRLATAIAKQLGLDEDTVATTGIAAQVYDIGLLTVSSDLLKRPEKLSSMQDLESIQDHVARSREVLMGVAPEIATIAYHVRERFNGSGYPDGLVGSAIPLLSRILAVAGAFCSLVSERPHRKAFLISEAITDIQSRSGTWYDPACVNALVEVLPEVLKGTASLPARTVPSVAAGVR